MRVTWNKTGRKLNECRVDEARMADQRSGIQSSSGDWIWRRPALSRTPSLVLHFSHVFFVGDSAPPAFNTRKREWQKGIDRSIASPTFQHVFPSTIFPHRSSLLFVLFLSFPLATAGESWELLHCRSWFRTWLWPTILSYILKIRARDPIRSVPNSEFTFLEPFSFWDFLLYCRRAQRGNDSY